MKILLVQILILFFLVAGSSIVNAQNPNLNEWGFNIDGTEYYSPDTLPSTVDKNGFNFINGPRFW
jgi:hypothetical protein